jgi:DNA-binding CsgD family transcriptional regulator
MLVYVILGTSLILITIRLVKRKINKENAKTRAEAARDKKLLELELEQLRLQAEKDKINKDKVLLEEDVLYKSKELANYTMMLVKKKDIFSEIRDDILELRRYVKNEISKKKIQNMYKKLNQHAIGEEYMHVFETNFEQVHHDFFTSLKTHYPDLSQRELRLCAFIKMNLTNKEISPLLNISVRGVETARYRLRKKMDLEHDANLTEYLESIDYEKA